MSDTVKERGRWRGPSLGRERLKHTMTVPASSGTVTSSPVTITTEEEGGEFCFFCHKIQFFFTDSENSVNILVVILMGLRVFI